MKRTRFTKNDKRADANADSKVIDSRQTFGSFAISGNPLKAEVRRRNFNYDTGAHDAASRAQIATGIQKGTYLSGVIHSELRESIGSKL
jgi:hypothetical protein